MDRLMIVGCGLTGSHTPYPLASSMRSAEWEYDVTYVDFDEVEHRNAPATLPSPIGPPILKADFVCEMGKALGLRCGPRIRKVKPKNVSKVLGDANIIFGAVDNDKAREVMWLHATANDIPYIDVGVNDMAGRVSWLAGENDSHPFAPGVAPVLAEKKEEEKLPPCALFGTRKMAVLTVELAVQSLATFVCGHDPHDVVLQITGIMAERGDMVGWSIVSSQDEIVAKATYIGRYAW